MGADLPPSFARCLRALVAGQVTNALVPFRAGEALSLGLLRFEGAPLAAAAAALGGGKALDLLLLAALGALVLGGAVTGTPLGPAAILCAVVMAIGLLALPRLPLGGRLARRLGLPGLRHVVLTARRPASLLVVVATTFAVMALGVAANALVLAGVGVPPTFDLCVRVLLAGYLVGLAPAPPARVGVFEAGVTVALMSGGVSAADALAASVLLHMALLVELALLLAVTQCLAGARAAVPAPSQAPAAAEGSAAGAA